MGKRKVSELYLGQYVPDSSNDTIEKPKWRIYTSKSGIAEALENINEILTKDPTRFYQYFNPEHVIFVDKVVKIHTDTKRRDFTQYQVWSTKWAVKKIFDHYPELEKYYNENTWFRESVDENDTSTDWVVCMCESR